MSIQSSQNEKQKPMSTEETIGKDTRHQLSKMNILRAYKYVEFMNIIVIPVNNVNMTLVQIPCQIGQITGSINSMCIKRPLVTGLT